MGANYVITMCVEIVFKRFLFTLPLRHVQSCKKQRHQIASNRIGFRLDSFINVVVLKRTGFCKILLTSLEARRKSLLQVREWMGLPEQLAHMPVPTFHCLASGSTFPARTYRQQSDEFYSLLKLSNHLADYHHLSAKDSQYYLSKNTSFGSHFKGTYNITSEL